MIKEDKKLSMEATMIREVYKNQSVEIVDFMFNTHVVINCFTNDTEYKRFADSWLQDVGGSNDIDTDCNGAQATTYTVGGQHLVLIKADNLQSLRFSLLAHEITHVAVKSLDRLGLYIDSNNDEPLAYMIEYFLSRFECYLKESISRSKKESNILLSDVAEHVTIKDKKGEIVDKQSPKEDSWHDEIVDKLNEKKAKDKDMSDELFKSARKLKEKKNNNAEANREPVTNKKETTGTIYSEEERKLNEVNKNKSMSEVLLLVDMEDFNTETERLFKETLDYYNLLKYKDVSGDLKNILIQCSIGKYKEYLKSTYGEDKMDKILHGPKWDDINQFLIERFNNLYQKYKTK